jgi:hypothetical protein
MKHFATGWQDRLCRIDTKGGQISNEKSGHNSENEIASGQTKSYCRRRKVTS